MSRQQLYIVALAVAVAVIVAIGISTASAQEVDQGPVQCRDFPFPFSVLCLANKAAYQPSKQCPEISQSRIYAAGQQCDAGDRDREGRISDRGRECSHSYGQPK